ncbi:MAG: lipoprotein [Rhodoferax sp.]|nr:lipoprotein [Rhodoferax sp.]
MLLLIRILVSPFVLAASAVTLAACGQQGPLYLPTDPPPGKRPAATPKLPPYLQPNTQPAAPMPADSATSTTPGARPASQ